MMSIKTERSHPGLDPGGLVYPGDDGEVEVAFLLENGQPGDPLLLRLLIERYGGEIHRLVFSLLDDLEGRSPANESVLALLGEIFACVVANRAEFRGEASVRNWLYREALRVIQARRSRDALAENARAVESDGDRGVYHLPVIRQLKEGERVILILHYGFGMSLPDMAHVLGIREQAARIFLASSRHHLQKATAQTLPATYRSHQRMRDRIQSAADGELEGLSEHLEQLRQHLASCPDCQAYADWLSELKETLVRTWEERWPRADLGPSEIDRIQAVAQVFLEAGKSLKHPQLPVRQAIWVTLISLALILTTWSFYRSGFDRSRLAGQPAPALPGPPTPTSLPEPVEIGEVIPSKPAVRAERTLPEAFYSYEPSLSGNGRWIAFSSTVPFGSQDESGTFPDLFLYDHMQRSLVSIPVAENGPGPGGGFSPSISQDGRWVAYTAFVEQPATEAPWRRGYLELFLHDRVSGRTERIDLEADGEPGYADSFVPTFSADGRWLSFWSTAGNLAPGDGESCLEVDSQAACLDVFVYDLVSHSISRIPVGRQRNLAWATKPVSLSADGRLAAMTIYASDQIAGELGITKPMQAFVVDSQSGQFTQVDISSEGVPGGKLSFAPSLSADGHFVAFISQSILVTGVEESGVDTQGTPDVFLRDLVNGTTELISAPEAGIRGFEVIGRPYPSNEIWGNNLSLSSDGRFIAFLSGPDGFGECLARGELGCNAIYLRDRLTGEIRRIAGPSMSRHYLFPSISADGRWLSYIDIKTSCRPTSAPVVCAEVWLYDWESDWTYAVTKGKYTLPDMQWLSESRLAEIRGGVSDLAFSPGGETLAITGFSDARIELRGSSYGLVLAELESSTGATVSSLVFSPDGEWLAAGLADGRVDIWRLSDKSILYTLDGHPGRVLQVEFSQDGQWILARTPDAIWLWQRQGKFFSRAAHLQYPAGSLKAAALFPNGKYLATTGHDGTVWVQAVPSGEVQLRLSGHVEGAQEALAISPSGIFLAAGWQGGGIDLWQIGGQRDSVLEASYLKTLLAPDSIQKLAFSVDGRELASSSSQGDLQLWSVPAGEWLDSPGSMQQDPFGEGSSEAGLHLSGVFAFGKGDLAAASSSGDIYQWEGLASRESPHFFRREVADGVHPPGARRVERRIFQPGQGYTYAGWDVRYRSLYELNAAASFDVLAPHYVPPGFAFEWAQLSPNGTVILYYTFTPEPGSEPAASLSIRQVRYSENLPRYPVGNSAKIETVDLGGRIAEYARGDWVSYLGETSDLGNGIRKLFWVWESSAPSQRMRWRTGDLEISISYNSLGESGAGDRYLSQADLADIGKSMRDLGLTLRPHENLDVYLFEYEDICAAIAGPEGRTPGYSIVSYDFSEDCTLIFQGRPLQASLDELRLPFVEADLNCDGIIERLEVVLSSANREAVPFNAVLRTPSSTGLYEDVWKIPIAFFEGEAVTQARLVRLERCERFLALNTFTGGAAALKVFHWDGTEMELVLEEAGWLEDPLEGEGTPGEFVVHRVEVDPSGGDCSQLTLHYAWNGRAFEQVAESGESPAECSENSLPDL